MASVRFAVLALLLLGSPAVADDATPVQPVPPAYVFSEAQTKVIAEILMARRDAAAAEYRRLDEVIAEIVRQAQRIQATPPAALPAPKP